MFETINYKIEVHCLTGYIANFIYTNQKHVTSGQENVYGKKLRYIFEQLHEQSIWHRRKYFGLSVVKEGVLGAGAFVQKIFLDLDSSIINEIKMYGRNGSLKLFLEFKFYIEHPLQLTDKVSLYYYYLQMKSNLKYLPKISNPDVVLLLAAFIFAIEFGVYSFETDRIYKEAELSDFLPHWLLDQFPKSFVYKSIRDLQKDFVKCNKVTMMKKFVWESFCILELSTHFFEVKPPKEHNTAKQISKVSPQVLGISPCDFTVYNLNISDKTLQPMKSYDWSKLPKFKFRKDVFSLQIAKLPRKHRCPLKFQFASKHEAERFFKLCCETCKQNLVTKVLLSTINSASSDIDYYNTTLKTEKFHESLISGDQDSEYADSSRGIEGLKKWRNTSEHTDRHEDESNNWADVSSGNETEVFGQVDVFIESDSYTQIVLKVNNFSETFESERFLTNMDNDEYMCGETNWIGDDSSNATEVFEEGYWFRGCEVNDTNEHNQLYSNHQLSFVDDTPFAAL